MSAQVLRDQCLGGQMNTIAICISMYFEVYKELQRAKQEWSTWKTAT